MFSLGVKCWWNVNESHSRLWDSSTRYISVVISNPRTEISHLYHHTYISLYMTRDCRINLYVRLVRIDFRRYGRRFAYTSRHFITFNTKSAFRKFFFYYFEYLPFGITFKLENLNLTLNIHVSICTSYFSVHGNENDTCTYLYDNTWLISCIHSKHCNIVNWRERERYLIFSKDKCTEIKLC